jgi:hypothetical protein
MLSYVPLALFSSVIPLFIMLWAAAGGIYGIVSAHDRPIAGATVSVFLLEGTSDYSSNIVTRTDKDGRFNLALRPGDYIVLVTIEGKRIFQGQQRVTGELSRLDITLDPVEQLNTDNIKPTCSPVVKSLEVRERTFAKLSDGEQLNHVYLYVGDIHRTPFHLAGSRNDLYIMEFGSDPPGLNRVQEVQDQRRLLKQVQAEALRSTELSYDGVGASTTFAAHSVIYHLTVVAMTNRPGSNNESVTISLCRQGSG